jgi:aspartyl-tRNA(Asn)/glutamyl-tRNA(Gln) amidotransferase subunit C
MAKLTRKEVEEIALLARLHLEPQEIEQMQDELGAILAHFRSIAVADTNGIAPMTHAVPMDAPLRPDAPSPSLPAADALRAAPRRDGDLFVVPAILPGSE